MVASHRKVQFGWWSVVLWCNACKLCESTDPFSHFYCPCDTVLHDFRDMCFLFVVSLYHCLHIASCKNTSNDAKYRYFQAIKTGFYIYLKKKIISILIMSENNKCFFISDTWLIFKWNKIKIVFFFFFWHFYVTISLSDTWIISSVYIKNHDLV